MVNDLEDGYAYLLENTGVWVPTVANISLAGFTAEGTDWIKFKIPRQWIKHSMTGIQPDVASSGTGFMTRTYRRNTVVDFMGMVSYADLENIETFIQSDRHTASSESTYKPYYLIMRRSVSSYVKFTDNTGTRREYCKGAVSPELTVTWNGSKSLITDSKFTFWSVW